MSKIVYGKLPIYLGQFEFDLPEMMYYLYLPVVMDHKYDRILLPPNLGITGKMIEAAIQHTPRDYRYVYLSARKGWATADNPLNRPGWHCDGFGTEDLNYVWWTGAGTRFAIQTFYSITEDHNRSLKQFDEQVMLDSVVTYPEKGLYQIDPSVVHSTPIITKEGMRQYVKISFSDQKYNLENNSHNYLFNYSWPLHSRETLRNDPHKAQLDYVA
jgi:hypothetical protein